MHTNEESFMLLALEQARLAAQADEVPVGAVVVGPDGVVLGAAHDAERRCATRRPMLKSWPCARPPTPWVTGALRDATCT